MRIIRRRANDATRYFLKHDKPVNKKKIIVNTNHAKQSNSIKSSLIAPCGMNCRLCRAYIREKRACPGCYGNNSLKSRSCAMCRIKNCEIINAGNIKFCFACEKYPCEKLSHLDKRYRTIYGMSMLDNLENINKFGIKIFIKQEKERWACKVCGEIICVHKENCNFCGSNWR